MSQISAADASSEMDNRRARALWRDLIDLYNSQGRAEMARSCATLCVAHGLWKDPAQRPIDYDAGIEPVPVHDPRAFDVCRYLEDNFDVIKSEVGLGEVAREGGTGYFAVHEPLVASGKWDEVIFYEAGIRVAGSARSFPRTAEIVDGLPESVRRAGTIMLSRMSPGTHIVAHCGFTNRRLRLHLGIQIPKDAFMRVKDRTLEWREGECLVFDDSFEHEVWHFGAAPRIVLLADLPHPQCSAQQWGAAIDLNQRIEDFMAKRGIARIVRSDGALSFEPDGPTGRMLERWIAELGVDSVALDAEGTVAHDRR